jgi:hypothetical protein
MMFCSGQIALDPRRRDDRGDVEAQTRACSTNLAPCSQRRARVCGRREDDDLPAEHG